MQDNQTGRWNNILFIEPKTDIRLLICISLWFIAFFHGLQSALSVWLTSEIFNHCLFIIPVSFYLIWEKRQQLRNAPIQTESKWLILAIPLTTLYIFGLVGDIALFMHAASFSFLPLIFITLLGYKACKPIIFPLGFILFSIPVGEALIPTLQDIAATISIFLLRLTDIPTYINGLYIEIPEGRFLVAEACSGISFFIVSIVFGCLFSHIYFYSLKRKMFFVILAFFVPIIANGIRVYGIIYIAHISDMKYAVGADHLIYGWFFYCFVLALLTLLGHFMRDEEQQIGENEQSKSALTPPHQLTIGPFLLLIIIMLAQMAWAYTVNLKQSGHVKPIALDYPLSEISTFSIQPKIENADKTYYFKSKLDDVLIDNYIAQYVNNSQGELVSGIHRIYSPDHWSLMTSSRIALNADLKINQLKVTNPNGNIRLITSWYQTPYYTGSSAIKTKLTQTLMSILGQSNAGYLVIVSTPLALDKPIEPQYLVLQERSLTLINKLSFKP